MHTCFIISLHGVVLLFVIIECADKCAERKPVVVVGTDTDLLVMLVALSEPDGHPFDGDAGRSIRSRWTSICW